MTWFGGACHTVEARRQFLDVVQSWAKLSHAFFSEPPELMVLDGAERDRVAVATRCAMDTNGHQLDEVIPRALDLGWRLHVRRGPGPWYEPKPGDRDGHIEIPRVRLHGISFVLFNPLSPGYEQPQGFFFLDVPSLPQLDGQLVDIKPRNPAFDWVSPIHGIADVDWVVDLPYVFVDDRYLASWPRRLAAWVKCFILPDLQFGTEPGDPEARLSDHLAGYPEMRDGLQARLQAGVPLGQLREETLQHLFKEYVAQTQVWGGGTGADGALLEFEALADKRKELGLV